MNRYRVSFETYVEVDAKDEDDAELKAGETNMDFWQEGDVEVLEVSDND